MQTLQCMYIYRWADCPYTTRTATTAGLPTVQDLDTIFNGPSQSVKDVYLKNSYGKLTINSIFTDWITLDVTEAQAAGVCIQYIGLTLLS